MPASKKRKNQINNENAAKKNRLSRNNLKGFFDLASLATSPNPYATKASSTPETSFSTASCKTWFQEFTTECLDVIEPDGMQKFCLTLGVEPDNIVMLILAHRLRAKQMGYFTIDEWLEGMQKLKCDSMSKLHKRIPYLMSLLDDSRLFREIYRFAFDFALEKDQRTLEKNSAKLMIHLLFESRWKLVEKFEQFLEVCETKYINRDQWNNIYEFSKNISDDCSNYDMDGAWPVLLDEFVEYIRSVQS